MKTISIAKLALVLSVASYFSFAQQPPVTAADYARAEKMLDYNTEPLVYRDGANPHFLPDGRFWYAIRVPSGVEFVLFDPSNGERKVAPKLADLGVTLPPRPAR